MIKNTPVCILLALINFSCRQEGDHNFESFWKAYQNNDLNFASIQLDSLKAINPNFHSKDTTIAYMDQVLQNRRKTISDSIDKVRADSLKAVSDSIEKMRADSLKVVSDPIKSKLPKSLQTLVKTKGELFCFSCNQKKMRKQREMRYECCNSEGAIGASIDWDTNNSTFTTMYVTPLTSLGDDDEIKFIMSGMSELIEVMDPNSKVSVEDEMAIIRGLIVTAKESESGGSMNYFDNKTLKLSLVLTHNPVHGGYTMIYKVERPM